MATTKVSVHKDPRKKHPWIVRWFGEYDPLSDKERRYCKSFRVKREAEQFQAEKQAEFDKGTQRDRPEDITLKEFCDLYMNRRSHEWREKTRRQIEDLCNRLKGYFGANTLLRNVTTRRAASFWSSAKCVRQDSVDQPLSRHTMNRLVRDSKTLFKYAVNWELVTANPFDGLRQMRVSRRNRRDSHYMTPEQYMALLRVAPNLGWKVLYALAYTSAARLGELVNLTEQDIDFSSGKLLVRGRAGSKELPPFNVKDHEDREVPLPRHTLRLVEGWLRQRPCGSPLILLSAERYQRVLERWTRYRLAARPWINDYMVNNVNRELLRHVKWAGWEPTGRFSMHCFRKSCGQNWANHLPMNVVKELMGHSDISTTAEFYSSVSPEHENQAQWVTQAIIKGGRGTKTDARLTPEAKLPPNRKVG